LVQVVVEQVEHLDLTAILITNGVVVEAEAELVVVLQQL
jgi:hypothetical protein